MPKRGGAPRDSNRLGEPRGRHAVNLIEILKTAYKLDASDVHLIAGHPPVMRVHQVMTPMDFPVISPETARSSSSRWPRRNRGDL
jgi:Tfp pilus assembly pilus retraction ATPase PilT